MYSNSDVEGASMQIICKWRVVNLYKEMFFEGLQQKTCLLLKEVRGVLTIEC